MTAETLTQEEFTRRFVAEMLSIAGPTYADGGSVEEYAREAAPGYFEDDFGMTPEECASTDVSYWEAE